MSLSAQGRNRTAHTGIFSPLLYQLSYLGSGRRYNANRVSGGQGSVVVLALFAVCVGAAAPARAQGFDAENAPPLLSPTSYLTLESSGVLPSGALAIGTVVAYARAPLVLRDPSTNAINAVAISDRASTFIGGAFGFARRFEIAVRSSASWQRGEFGVFAPDGTLIEPPATALGDTTVRLKGRLLGGTAVRGLHVALGLAVGLPTGAPAAFTGDAGLTARPQALIGWQASRLSLDGFIGYNLRPRYGSPGARIAIGDELAIGAAVAWTAVKELLWVLAEARLAVGREPGSDGAFPSEAQVGARTIVGEGLVIQAGIGTGLTSGYGSPRFRALAGLMYVWGQVGSAPAPTHNQPAAAPVDETPEPPPPAAPAEPAQPAPAAPAPDKRPAKEKRRRSGSGPFGDPAQSATPMPSDASAKTRKKTAPKATGKGKPAGKRRSGKEGDDPASP